MLLSDYLWQLNRKHLEGKQILELGCGTGLVGLLAAACGASVVLTDSEDADLILKNVRVSLLSNNPVTWVHTCLKTTEQSYNEPIFITSSQVLPLSWGSFSAQFMLEYEHRPLPDLIVASDAFYSETEPYFDALFATLHYFFSLNPSCRFITAYQVRSAHLNWQRWVSKWGFKIRHIEFAPSQAAMAYLPGESSQNIRLFEISLDEGHEEA